MLLTGHIFYEQDGDSKVMRVGDWVEVRQEAEILCTLDAHGTLEGTPFMPEMLQFCGRRFQISKRAHKTCDTATHQSRRLVATVHLDTRCSGEAHGGCQAGCLLFWKEAWLRPVNNLDSTTVLNVAATTDEKALLTRFTRGDLLAQCVKHDTEGSRYYCQATQIRDASNTLHWWDLRQYLEDLRSGNLTLRNFIYGAITAAWVAVARIRPWPSSLVRWLYEHFRFLWGGKPFPFRVGTIPRGARTPACTLNLLPGELVRVLPLAQIDRTLDRAGQNRGLYFDPEQVPYTNGIFRVLRRVDRIISEETGKMLPLKVPTVLLDSVVCQGRYGSCRFFCPRSAYLLWREAWLERVETTVVEVGSSVPDRATERSPARLSPTAIDSHRKATEDSKDS